MSPESEGSDALPPEGMRFVPHFTRPSLHPFDAVAYERRTARITDADGSVLFEMADVEAPVAWSQLATDILVSKYFRKAGLPEIGGETSIRQVIHRIARTIRTEGERTGVFAWPEDAETFERELIHLLLNQMGAFNSPVWFNCGLWQEYGLTGSGGNWFWDADSRQIALSENAYEHPQCAACFIQSVDDDLMGIFELMKNEARLFKFGSGTGSNFSAIRGRQEKLSGGGASSGLLSFLEVLDRGAGATKSGGTTRRAAKMVSLDMDHPEIVDFIQWKQKEERKARALIEAGYPADFNGEAYHTVSGQNANNSVRLSDRFMEAVLSDQPWQTTFRTTGEVCETFQAADLLEKIAEAAWACADPGVQYDDRINEWNTCLDTARIRGSNPCSEFHFLDDTACNLASLNLMQFLDAENRFDIAGFRHACRVFFTAQEILVDLASYPTEKIARNSHEYRPLGLGYANLGALLMVQGIPYDSEAGYALAGAVTALLHGEAYRTSAELAAVKGPFDRYAQNQASMQRVVHKHQAALQVINPQACPPDLLAAVHALWQEVLFLGERHGYRNAQATVLAPTGTIGLLMDCDTTGIEPDFALVKWKKLAGGGYFKIVNQSVPRALRTLGYAEAEIAAILAHVDDHQTVEGAPGLHPEHLPVFDCANRCGDGQRFIAPMAHLRMMAAAQPFLSGAISKTVNLPHEATVADIQAVYLDGWRMGLKGVALYRDGSKFSQPLSSAKSSTSEGKETPLAWGTARQLPPKRTGFTQEARVAGQKVHLRTGEFSDGALGEIFIDMFKEGAAYRSLLNCFAVAISLGLQAGVPLEKFVNAFTFTRFEPAGLTDHPRVRHCTSLVDFIFRLLGLEYLHRDDLAQVSAAPEGKSPLPPANAPLSLAPEPDALIDAPFCSQCGSLTRRNGACFQCDHCGHSEGCS